MSFGFWKPSGTDVAGSGEGDDRAKRAPPGGGVAPAPPAPVSGPLAQQRMRLPIYRHKRQILYALENFEVLVIVGVSAAVSS